MSWWDLIPAGSYVLAHNGSERAGVRDFEKDMAVVINPSRF